VAGPGDLCGLLACLGAWRSLVARTVRVGEVPGSNPGAPIFKKVLLGSRVAGGDAAPGFLRSRRDSLPSLGASVDPQFAELGASGRAATTGITRRWIVTGAVIAATALTTAKP
jgi:hypothetical protein